MRNGRSILSLFSMSVVTVFGAPVFYPPKEMVGFMKSYGYLQETTGGPADIETLYTEEGFRDVIRQVQRFGGLNETGQLDESTLALMTKPRCGVPDVLRDEQPSNNRTKRYVVATPGWRKRHLTYFLTNWAQTLESSDTAESLKKAFSLWSEITPLRFHATSSPDADMVMIFSRGHHGDSYPFDGPGNTLAHAFFPYQHDAQGGDIHFDGDEEWVNNKNGKKSKGGVDFFTVATHEIGHSLGLSHSTAPGSIMFPYYKGYTEELKLGYDDVLAMYDLYVRQAMFEENPTDTEYDKMETAVHNRDRSPSTEAPAYPDRPMRPERPIYPDRDRPVDRTRPTHPARPVQPPFQPARPTLPAKPPHQPVKPSQPERPNVPNGRPGSDPNRGHANGDGKEDRDRNNNRPRHPPAEEEPRRNPNKGKKPTRKPNHPQDEGRESKDNRTKIPDLCDGHWDAAALLRNEIFVFKGLYMWRFRDRGLLMNGYPVPFHTFFVGLPKSIKKIDAIYQKSTDHKIVVFTGRKFWLFTGDRFTADSPKSLTTIGLPPRVDSVDAAFVWAKNDKTYLFKDRQYWRLDEREETVEEGYPLQIHSRWSGIPDQLDTAMTFTDGQTYFFKEAWYWRFDNQGVKADINFPRKAAEDWIGC